MPDHITGKVDVTGLMQMVEEARKYSHRTPAKAINTAAYYVARRAMELTPKATVSGIDSQLNAVSTLSTNRKSGKPLKKPKLQVALQSPEFNTRAVATVLARFNPNSKYNKATGGYWQLDKSKFGKWGSAKWGRKIINTAIRMVKARHSSIAFLKSCWIPAIRTLAPLAAKTQRQNADIGGAISKKDEIEGGGWAYPATDGVVVTCEIANDAGGQGKNEVLSKKHNDALWKYAAPQLQPAIDAEFFSTCKYIAEQELKAMKKIPGITIDV